MPNRKLSLALPALLLMFSYSLYAADPVEQPALDAANPAEEPAAPAAEPAEQQPAAAAAAEPPGPVAIVNGTPISADLIKAYARLSRNQNANNSTVDVKALVNDLINQELLLQEAERQKLVEQDPQLAMQLEIARRNLVATAVIRKLLSEQRPSEEVLKQESERLAASLTKKEYKVRHILVDSEEKANAVLEELKGGADFSTMAKTHSSDNSAANGGELDWFSLEIMPEPFGKAVTTLSKGSFTEQPVKTQFGWHIILLDDVRDASPPSAEELNQRVVRELQDRIMNEYLDKLRSAATIEIK
jgi:peptidyl-prolyl cis-trans isomerase C